MELTGIKDNDAGYLDKFVREGIARNPNVSFSGLFKRHRDKCPMIGEIIILNHIARIMGQEGVLLNRDKAFSAAKCCLEYKEMKSGRNSILSDILKKNLKEFKDRKNGGPAHIKDVA